MANGIITLTEMGLGNADLTAIGKLSGKGMSPEQIADAVEKVGQINSSASEIDGSVNANKRNFKKADSNYYGVQKSTISADGTLVISAKLGKTKDIAYTIGPAGINGLSSIISIVTDDNTSLYPRAKSLYISPYTVFTAAGDMVSAPYKVRAINNGDSNTGRFTGGWHGSNIDGTGTPTATRVSWSLYIDGINLTTDKTTREGLSAVYTSVHRICGYNTTATLRYILEETITYTIQNGFVKVENSIKALEDIEIITYYGLQTIATSTGWEGTIVYKPCDFKERTFTKDLDAGESFTEIANRMIQRGTAYELETQIDRNYGLGNREYVLDIFPSIFSVFLYRKSYFNLVNGISLIMTANDTKWWRGSLLVRLKDADRN